MVHRLSNIDSRGVLVAAQFSHAASKQGLSVTALPGGLCSALCEPLPCNLQAEAELVELQKTHQHLLQQAASMAAAAHAQLTDTQAATSAGSQAGGAHTPHVTLWPHEPASASFGHQGLCLALPLRRQSLTCSDPNPDALQAWRVLSHCSPRRCWQQQLAAQPWRTLMPGSWLLPP